MELDRLLNTIYRIYKDDLQIEDNPPLAANLPYKEGDIVELKGNIYIYLWKKTDYGYLGLLATPYTLLAHPSHPRVRTDNLIYKVMAITDIYIPLREETLRKYLTDRVEVFENKQVLEEKIEKSIKRRKIYHPVREKFLRDEAKRTAFLIGEFLKGEEERTEKIVIRIPKRVWEKIEKPQRLAAESEQETAENRYFLIVKQNGNSYSLILKDYNLLGKRVKIFLKDEPIYDGLLDTDTLIVEVEGEVTPTLLADLLKVEE